MNSFQDIHDPGQFLCSSYIGIDPGREYHFLKTRPAYNSRTKKRLFVAIEPEGKDGHFNVLFLSSNCLLQEKKKSSCFTSSPGQFRRRLHLG